MTKAKSLTPKSAASTPKGVKNTSIGKNKTPKFKNTPVGKVPMINGTPKNKNKKNDGNDKRKSNSPLQPVTPKSKGNSPASKPNTPKSKKNTPKGKSPREVSQEELKKRIARLQGAEDDENEDDSDEDVNEGIEIDEDVSDEEADSDDVSEDTSGIEGILGKSLAEDSDEDDDDFQGDEDEEDQENRGVKMFKGLKPEGNNDDDDDDNDDESEDEDEDEDGDDSDDNSGPGLKALLGNSLADDDDDEDFMDNEEDDDDEDEDISDEDEEAEEQSPVAKKNKVALKKSKDADEEDDEEEDDEDDETSKLSDIDEDDDDDGDDDDDDDDDGDEDDDNDDDDDDNEVDDEQNSEDENARNLEKHISRKTLTPEEREERDKRTLFVGNIPKMTKKGELLKIFRKYGVIEAIRIRGVVPADEKTSKKVAAIKGETHPDSSSIHCFIRYESDASARKALIMNGQKLGDHFLRVDISANDAQKPDHKKAVFLGNLPFKLDDNAVWKHFEDCGKIISIRVIRDRRTGVGKGFGYINFETSDSVALALKLNGTTLKDREIRVKLCTDQSQNQKQHNQFGKRPLQQPHQDGGSAKKQKDNSSDPVAVATRNSQNAERRKENKQKHRSQGDRQRLQANGDGRAGSFQGQKADDKKKPKINKQDKKKKQFAAKLATKPKKRTSD